MKKYSKIIFVLVLLVALAIGWFWLRNNVRSTMQDTLSARYPTDSISVKDVSITLIPLGAKGVAHAEHENLDFEVAFIKGIGQDDEVTDKLYDARTRKYYTEIFDTTLATYSTLIEGYYLDPIEIGTSSLNQETGRFPVAVNILLKPDIKTSEEFISTVKRLATSLEQDQVAGVDGYRFVSFPGSVLESDLPSLGLEAAWLTMPTPTPAPTPTPRPTTSGTGTGETSSTTQAETSRATSSSTGTQAKAAKPAFSYAITLLTDHYQTSDAWIRNGVRTVTYSTKDLQILADEYHLTSASRDLLDQAQSLQTMDQTSGTTTRGTTRANAA